MNLFKSFKTNFMHGYYYYYKNYQSYICPFFLSSYKFLNILLSDVKDTNCRNETVKLYFGIKGRNVGVLCDDHCHP